MVSAEIHVRTKLHVASAMGRHLCRSVLRSRYARREFGIQVKFISIVVVLVTFSRLDCRGVVTVDVYLSYLDINQCSMPHYVPNAFKGSDRCDYQSTVVRLLVERFPLDRVGPFFLSV